MDNEIVDYNSGKHCKRIDNVEIEWTLINRMKLNDDAIIMVMVVKMNIVSVD